MIRRPKADDLAIGISVLVIFLVLFFHSQSRSLSRKPSSVGEAETAQGSVWVVDTQDPGPNPSPPAGTRSLFDYLVSVEESGKGEYQVPFPFTRLLEKIQGTLDLSEGDPGPKGYNGALIPLGRSLQRNAGAPVVPGGPSFFFQSPRVVISVDAPPKQSTEDLGMFLKDRLYIGYQERSAVLEVISYNEGAGRFEFQVVKDYRDGGKPEVVYANRSLCIQCHQNHGPIFPAQPWDETNANPLISGKILEANGGRIHHFHGVPVIQGIDPPYAIDKATKRSNLFSVYQKIWKEGCESSPKSAGIPGSISGPRCRGAVLASILQYRLTGSAGLDIHSKSYRETVLPAIQSVWYDRWPRGLAIPNPEIPNRNPMKPDSGSGFSSSQLPTDDQVKSILDDLIKKSNIPAKYEPLNPRLPLSTWNISDTDQDAVNAVITNLGSWFSNRDIKDLDENLFQRGLRVGARRSVFSASCDFQTKRGKEDSVLWVNVDCRLRGQPTEASDSAGTAYFKAELRIQDHRGVSGSMERIRFRLLNENCVFSKSELPESPGNPAASDENRPLCPGTTAISVSGTLSEAQGGWSLSLIPTQGIVGTHSRTPEGKAIEKVELTLSPEKTRGTAQISVIDDFSILQSALQKLAQDSEAGISPVLFATPFRRDALLKALYERMGFAGKLQTSCCSPERVMPPVQVQISSDPQPEASSFPPPLRVFQRRCVACHGNTAGFPPGFLSGSQEEVLRKLDRCAPRIWYRLRMWDRETSQRKIPPMPPPYAVGKNEADWGEWRKSPDFSALKNYIGQRLSANGLQPDNVLIQEFNSLGSCK